MFGKPTLRNTTIQTLLAAAFAFAACAAAVAEDAPSYAIVVSRATHDDEAWQKVVAALVKKHATRGAATLTYRDDVAEALPKLRAWHPRYTCFVARPEEATRRFVAQVHELTRQYDADPYTDTLWGILTGYDAANALAIAEHDEPLVVRRVAAGTQLAMEMVEEGVWYCELVKNKMVKKERDGKPKTLAGPDDTTRALAETLTDYRADLFVTSGHATERDWQIGFRYRNGQFRSKAGQLYGVTSTGERFPINSDHPRVYLAVGNCLMGHIDGPDAMALAWLRSAGVRQMVGYTVPTWFGYAGWGCLDYFVEQPGRYSLVEAFFANQHALVYSLEHGLGNERGLQFDKNVVAFYGDPGWEARMADGPRAFELTLSVEDHVHTLTITPNRGEASFATICTNGSQRGGRPFVVMLPERIDAGGVEIVEGAELEPVVADDFLLVPNPGRCNPSRTYRVVFRAKAARP